MSSNSLLITASGHTLLATGPKLVTVTQAEIDGANLGQRPDLIALNYRYLQLEGTDDIYTSDGTQLNPAREQSTAAPLCGRVLIAGEALDLGNILTVSRATGQALLADAGMYTKSFVLGYAQGTTKVGFPVVLVDGPLTLGNWEGLAGTSNLSPGMPYFLSHLTPGTITITPPTTPAVASCCIGIASSVNTLVIKPSRPILL